VTYCKSTRQRGRPQLELRCTINGQQRILIPYFLIIEADDPVSGLLLSEDELQGAALNVSALYDLCVVEPCPTAYNPTMINQGQGIVCEPGGGSGYLFVRAQTTNHMWKFVWLAGPTGSISIGTSEDSVPPNSILLGRIGVLPKPLP
jgi:hypothetical protein